MLTPTPRQSHLFRVVPQNPNHRFDEPPKHRIIAARVAVIGLPGSYEAVGSGGTSLCEARPNSAVQRGPWNRVAPMGETEADTSAGRSLTRWEARTR